MKKELITKFNFNLNKTTDKKQINGLIEFYNTEIIVNFDGQKDIISMASVLKVKALYGVGCIMLEAVYDDHTALLCRADMSFSETFLTASKRVNRYISNQHIDKNNNQYRLNVCPKCHRKIPAGSYDCPRCKNKSDYLKRLWEVAKPYRWYIYVSVILYFVIAGINLLLPYLNRILVDNYITGNVIPEVSKYILVVVGIVGVNILSKILSVARSVTQTQSASKVIVKLRNMTFDKITKMSLNNISKRTAGELMNRVTEDTNRIQRFITSEISNAIEEILMLIAVGTVLFIYDWRLALLIICPMPLVILSHRLMWKFLRSRYGRQWYVGAKANTVLHDIFSGIRVVKSFGMEDYEESRYDETIIDERKTRADNETLFAIVFPITQFLMSVGEFFLLYFVGTKILNNEMTLGTMAQFSSYVSMIYAPLRWISNLPRQLTQTMTSVAKVYDVIDEKPDVEDRPNAIDKKIDGVIEIEKLSFGYETTPDVLENITLTIQPGEFIGIVGKSGVGKSTLINLIMRMYDPDEGSIKIDGTDIRDITQESLRSNMGVVLQETVLFGGSLYKNIAYSKPDATPEEVINAAKIAGVHKFAVNLPDGYNTIIGEKGYTLSGGERQRVSIARALLHNPKILILDEATSSLDTETEKDIQDALRKLSEGRTTIAIAHRLSTLRNATRLVVLDNSRVAEVGSHEELLKLKGIYYELVMAQRQMSKMTH